MATNAIENATQERQDAERKRLSFHPFLPAPMNKPRILRWLKHFHAWFGVSGAVAGILFAWSGFVLNHRTDFRIGPENITTEFTLPAPAEKTFASGDAFGAYLKEQLDAKTAPRAPGMGGGMGAGMGVAVPGGPAIESPSGFQANFTASSEQIAASYDVGSDTIQITRTERPAIRTVNRMHVGVASNFGWQVIMDAFSGALIFLCISGVLIWSRLDGPRLLGAGLIGTSTGLTIFWILAGP